MRHDPVRGMIMCIAHARCTWLGVDPRIQTVSTRPAQVAGVYRVDATGVGLWS